MLTATITTLLVVCPLAYGARRQRGGGLIVRHPYNNPYSDASAARDEHVDQWRGVRAG